jgi:hypothetical protein
MRLINIRTLCAIIGLVASAATGRAQGTPADPSGRLVEVLPADVANRILAVIARARSHGLSGDALENRALKFAAKGVAPSSIERSVADQEERMERVRDTLQRARGRKPADDEIEAGAEAMRKGVDGSKVSALARSAPSGRSLAVPLYVIGSLVDRGLPSDSALARVEARLRLKVSDRDLESIEDDASVRGGRGNRPTEIGRELGEAKHPGSAEGAGKGDGDDDGTPDGVPRKARPRTPPGTKKPDASANKRP